MVIVVGGTKGGTGKSTLATNLAAIDVLKGHDVILIDCDKQGSASKWAEERENTGQPRVSVMQKFGGVSLTKELQALKKKYQRIFVDAGGYDSEELRASLLAATFLLIPIRPAQFDVWALPHIIEIVSQSQIYNPNLSVLFVINGVHTSPNVKEAESVLELANEVEGMEFAKSILHSRRAYAKAPALGLSVMELKGSDRDTKATAEILNLYEEIING